MITSHIDGVKHIGMYSVRKVETACVVLTAIGAVTLPAAGRTKMLTKIHTTSIVGTTIMVIARFTKGNHLLTAGVAA